MDEDYYILTLAAIARELSRENLTEASVYLAVGLPLSWAKKQGAAFRAYLLRNSSAEFDFRDKHYRIRFVGAGVFPQGYAAVVQSMETFTGSYMLCDIGNGTMNILQIIDWKPDGRQMFTEKYGVQQCILAMREALMREHNANPGEKILHRFLRKGTAGLDAALEETMRATAVKYTKEVFRVLREHGYDSRLMKLYVVGGGGCMLKNFASLNNTAVTINDDICATAKGYEHLALREISKNEKCRK